MKASVSTKNIHEKILNKITNDNELKKGIKKRCSLQKDIYKNEIFKNIHEGSILNYIRNIPKREIIETDRSEKEIKITTIVFSIGIYYYIISLTYC